MNIDIKQKQSQDASTKIDNSSQVFRDLVKSLKKKYDRNYYYSKKNQGQIQQNDSPSNQILSQIQHNNNNPQDCDSIVNRKQYNSEINSLTQSQALATDRHSFRFKMDEYQESIKLKPKGSVNGRDAIKKSPLKLNKSHHNHFVSKPQFSPTLKRKSLKQSKMDQKKYLLINNSAFLPKINKQQPEDMNNTDNKSKLNKTFNFRQHKLNSKMAKSTKITHINDKAIFQYCKMQFLDQLCQAKQIFAFFNQLCRMVNYYIEFPLIKKYKNCVYFGRPIINEQKYQGFLYYFDRKIYYGDFLNGQRSGQGIEVNFQCDVIYKGIFHEGMKTGKFQVIKPQQKYVGQLLNGFYHGIGKLVSKDSIYEGNFRNGEKHGLGTQIFPKTGLKLTGNFHHGYFDTKNQLQIESMMKQRLIQDEYSDSNWKRGFSQGVQYQQKLYESRQFPKEKFNQFQQNNMNSEYNINLLDERHHKANLFSMKNSHQYMRDSQTQTQRLNPINFKINKNPQKSGFSLTYAGFYDKNHMNNHMNDRYNNNNSKQFQSFDHSFDVNSRQDTQLSNSNHFRIPIKHDIQSYQRSNMNHQENHKKRSKFDSGNYLQMIQERMQTTQLQDPLPMPTFYKIQ